VLRLKRYARKYTVFQKSDAKIQITITMAYVTRIKYPFSGFNYHLSNVNVANFNKINRTICNVYVGKMIIKAAKRISNSDKICRSYSDLNFGVTFLEHSVDRKSAISLQRGQFEAKFQVEGVATNHFCTNS